MILVVVGTHDRPFDRLCRAAEALAGDERVVLQKGTSRVPTPRCEASAWIPHTALLDAMREARIVISHGGPSTLFEAVACGHVPIVVPRRAEHGEHVDDHQVAFVARMRSRMHVVDDPTSLPDAVREHPRVVADRDPGGLGEARAEAFALDLQRLCEDVVEGRAPRRRRRDRFRALQRWMIDRP